MISAVTPNRAPHSTPMNQTFTFKAQSLYGAYAPAADLCFYGSCFEEAVNGLNDELRTRAETIAEAGSKRSANERS
jgi:hypothetical protein